jgi:hypothetical protein
VNNALHLGYQFWIKLTVNRVYLDYGDSNTYKPDSPRMINGVSTNYFYDLRVGCYPDSHTFSDSASFISNVDVFVGASLENIYTMHSPTSNRDWCVIRTNEFATENAEAWPGTENQNSKVKYAKFSTDVSTFQPYSSFNLVEYHTNQKMIPEVIKFRIKSTFTNS